LTRQVGCGELYVDEWLSDPPNHCDPCDDCGNYVGHGCGCHDHHLFGLLHKLWGVRYAPSGPPPVHHGLHHGGGHPADFVGEAPADYFAAGDVSYGPMAQSAPMDEGFYDVGPGESVVPGSVRISEGGVVGEPTPATMPTPAPHELPGPSALKARKPGPHAPPARQAVHRQSGFSLPPPASPRQRPR
jgi:hypothetical protein